MDKIKNKDFLPRAMYKGELAMAYNPDMEPHYALRTLRRWIEHYPGLQERLFAAGMSQRQKILTPLQVGMIYDALGEP